MPKPSKTRRPGPSGNQPFPEDPAAPFWRTTPLAAMSEAQWESLCDGCGRCCLVKLEDEDDGTLYHTDIGCTLLDSASCRCRDYPNRQDLVPDCLRMTPDAAGTLPWLPPTCAYRLVAEGRDLYWWHPLVSGDPESVHAAGISVRGRVAANEDAVALDDLPFHIVDWPGEDPAASRDEPSEPKASGIGAFGVEARGEAFEIPEPEGAIAAPDGSAQAAPSSPRSSGMESSRDTLPIVVGRNSLTP